MTFPRHSRRKLLPQLLLRGADRQGGKSQPWPGPRLILLADRLGVSFAVRIEALLLALLPGRFELGRSDVPIRPALPGDGAQILAEFLHGWAAEEPIAVID